MICKTRYKFNKPVATFKVRGKLCKYTAGVLQLARYMHNFVLVYIGLVYISDLVLKFTVCNGQCSVD